MGSKAKSLTVPQLVRLWRLDGRPVSWLTYLQLKRAQERAQMPR